MPKPHLDICIGVVRFPLLGHRDQVGFVLPWRDATARVATFKRVAEMLNSGYGAELISATIHPNHRHPGDAMFFRFGFGGAYPKAAEFNDKFGRQGK